MFQFTELPIGLSNSPRIFTKMLKPTFASLRCQFGYSCLGCIDDSFYTPFYTFLLHRLKLNDDKTEFIIIGTRQQLVKVNIDSLQVGESSTDPSNRVKNLGCWFDGQLKMDIQINSICKTAFYYLYNIRTIRKFLNPECTEILVNAFVTSRLNFCNSLLYGLPRQPAPQITETPKCSRSPNLHCRSFQSHHSIIVPAPLASH